MKCPDLLYFSLRWQSCTWKIWSEDKPILQGTLTSKLSTWWSAFLLFLLLMVLWSWLNWLRRGVKKSRGSSTMQTHTACLASSETKRWYTVMHHDLSCTCRQDDFYLNYIRTVLKDNWPLKYYANRQADRQIDTQTKKAAFRLMSTTTVYQ